MQRMLELFHSRTAQALGSWLAILTTVFTVLSKLSPAWLGALSWPEAILLGIGMAVATSLLIATALAVGGWGYRLMRPAETMQSKNLPTLDHTPPAYDDTKLRQEVTKLSSTVKAVIQDYQTVLGNQARAEDETAKASKAITEQVASFMSDLSTRIDELSRDLLEVRRGCATLQEKIDENEKSVRESLYAVFARERLNDLARDIEYDAALLYDRLKSGENYTALDWDQWVNVHHHWERSLKEWVDTARWYTKDVKKRVMTVEDKEYDEGDWTVRDAQFPNADAVRRFKRHRIIQSHWVMVRDDADAGARNVAFHGQREKEQHGGKFHQ
jgi:hypothetical protein